MAQSLPQSKLPEVGGGWGALHLRASASHVDKLDWAADPRGPFCSTWETSVVGGPPALPVLTPSLWGGSLLRSDEHIHPPKLSSCVRLPRKLSHQVVCSLPNSHPTAGMCLLPCLSAPKDWAPDIFISCTSGWLAQSVLSTGLWNRVQSWGPKCHLLLNASLGPREGHFPPQELCWPCQ